MNAFRSHTARVVHLAWTIALIISTAIFALTAAVLIGLHFQNPAALQTGQSKSQHMPLVVSMVRVTWQDHVDVGSSAVITVSLKNTGTVDRATCPAATPRPAPGSSYQAPARAIGTPGVPLTDAFGPNYEGYASVHLNAIGFDAFPASIDAEALNQPQIDWGWSISPKTSGQQYALASITGTWRPCAGHGGTIQRQLWTSHPIRIVVDQPLLQRNSFDLVGFLTGTAGASSLLLVGLRFVWHGLEWLWAIRHPSKKNVENT